MKTAPQATTGNPRADYYLRTAAANREAAAKMTTPEFKKALEETADNLEETAHNLLTLQAWADAGAPNDYWD